jgi:hypothetical protein
MSAAITIEPVIVLTPVAAISLRKLRRIVCSIPIRVGAFADTLIATKHIQFCMCNKAR